MASSKNYTEVLIGGKVFTLSGFESEDYLQKVSTYLNHKLDECSNSEGYRKQSAETRSILLALNIADDYFKAKKQGGTLESDIEAKDKEMYDLKHELISVQIKLELRQGRWSVCGQRWPQVRMQYTLAVQNLGREHMHRIFRKKIWCRQLNMCIFMEERFI